MRYLKGDEFHCESDESGLHDGEEIGMGMIYSGVCVS